MRAVVSSVWWMAFHRQTRILCKALRVVYRISSKRKNPLHGRVSFVRSQPSGFYLAIWRMRLPFLSSILFSEFRKGVLLDMANSILETISSEFASTAEKVGSSVVAVHARRWMPSSGIEWKKGVVVTV